MAFKSHNKDTYAMKLMNTIFGGTPFSKLFLNVREKLSLCYYCAAGYNQLKGTVFVDCGIEEENIIKTEAEDILQKLGVPVSVVINSLYRQIISSRCST